MTQPPLLANENFPYPALLRLRASGVAVEAVAERMRGASDAAVLAHAAASGAWLVTYDRDTANWSSPAKPRPRRPSFT
jgi:hypothetical protein